MTYIESLNEDEKFALLFGIMAGDGCLSLVNGRKKFITITGSLDDDISFFKEIVSPLLNKFRGKDTNIKFRKDCRSIEFNFTDAKLFDFISSSGFPIGKKGQKLIVPKYFYDRNLLKYIVQGFFATDGSLVLTKNPNKFYPRIESVVIHKDFLKQIYEYLLSIGLKGSYYKSKSKPYFKWKTCQNKYRFQFNGKDNLLLFEKLIGFINPKQEKKFKQFLEYDKEYDSSIKGVQALNQKLIRDSINTKFIKMTLRGF